MDSIFCSSLSAHSLNMSKLQTNADDCADGIPIPIVKLNRWTIVVSVIVALILQQPLITTALFVVLLLATMFGPRGSLIFQIGKRAFAKQNLTAPREDRRLMRFNNTIAVVMLGIAQIAFVAGAPVVGWTLGIAIVIAASVALAGFCVGCFFYYQFRLQKTRLFG